MAREVQINNVTLEPKMLGPFWARQLVTGVLGLKIQTDPRKKGVLEGLRDGTICKACPLGGMKSLQVQGIDTQVHCRNVIGQKPSRNILRTDIIYIPDEIDPEEVADSLKEKSNLVNCAR